MRERSRNKPVADIPAEVNGITVGTPPIKSASTADIPEAKLNIQTADDPSLALKHQVEALRHNEQLVREHNERLQQERLALQHGCKT